MRRFVRNLTLFLIPLALLVAGVEAYLGSFPSGFQLKAQYLKNHKKDIEILALGSSHNQDAIDPAVFKKRNAANISYGGQDLRLDYKLLEKYIGQLPNLKYVLVEFGYHSLDIMHEGDYEKNSLYLRFYGINNFDRRNSLTDYSIFLSNPSLYLPFLNPFLKPTPVNEYGFETEMSAFDANLHRFKDMGYNTLKISRDRDNIFIQRHRKQNPAYQQQNKTILEKMIGLCLTHNVRPILVIPPVYATYWQEMIPEKKQRRDAFIAYLQSKYPQIALLDYENSSRFNVTDFYNEDHLNPQGAHKFSVLVDSLVSRL